MSSEENLTQNDDFEMPIDGTNYTAFDLQEMEKRVGRQRKDLYFGEKLPKVKGHGSMARAMRQVDIQETDKYQKLDTFLDNEGALEFELDSANSCDDLAGAPR